MAKRQSIKTLIPAIQRNADPVVLAEALGILQDQADLLSKAQGRVTTTPSSSPSVPTDVLIGSPTNLAITAATTDKDGVLMVTITGDLPVDANLAGLRFIVEQPTVPDPFPASLTLPGQLLNTIPVWYAKGDGSYFSQTFEVPKPTRPERWLIYALPFSEGYENPLVRLTHQAPPLPANVSPYAVLDLTSGLTVPGSELTDITLTGTPSLSPTGIGSLTISQSYVPPYLLGPLVSIGDFQGVTVWLKDAAGAVTNLGDYPYIPPVAFDAAPPDNLGSYTVKIPMPAEGDSVYLVVCAYSTTKRLPYRDPASAPAGIVATIFINTTTANSGLATQVGVFGVTLESRTAGGVNSGVKEFRYKYTFTKPVDPKWNYVSISRTQTDSSFVTTPGGESGIVAELIESPGYSGWFAMPQADEYWHFVAKSANFDTPPTLNPYSAPFVNVTLTSSGELVNAALSITSAMLQDLAVEARALADYAVTTTKYAPLSIVAAAIGLAAINDANIANLDVNKLTGNSMNISGGLVIEAGGSLTLRGYFGAQSLYIDTFGAHAGNWYGDLITDNIFPTGSGPFTLHSAFDFSSGTDAQTVGDLLLGAVGAASGTPTYFFVKNGLGVGYHTMDLTDVLNAMGIFIGAGTSGKFLQNNGSSLLWADPLSGGASATIDLTTATSLTVANGVVTGYA